MDSRAPQSGPGLTTNLKLAKRYAESVTLGGIPAEGQTDSRVCEMTQQGIEYLPHLLPGGQASSTSCLLKYLLSTNAHHPLPDLGEQ